MQKAFAGFPIQRGAQARENGVCIILYGKAGSGKTPLAATAVKSERYGYPMLYVDAEAGRKSIAHYDNIDFLPITTWSSVDKVMRQLMEADNPYKCVVFDNLSEMREMHMRTEVKSTDPQFKEWKINIDGIVSFVRQCRDYAEKSGISFILILWDADEEEKGLVANVTVKKLELTPALQKIIPGMVDVIGYITVNDDQSRTISFKQGRLTVAKFRRPRDDISQQIPLELMVRDPDMPVLADILETLKGGVPFPVDRYSRKVPPERKD